MRDNFKYKVATRCFTYNHASYIKDALSGFVSQIADEPLLFVIVDDASTDGEQDILRNWAKENLLLENNTSSYGERLPYGELIFAPYKGNVNLLFVVLLLFENHYQTGKEILKYEYISDWLKSAQYNALCEGDDYWTDPLKLQKECNYLDNNPDKSLVYTDCNVFFHDQNRLVNDAFKSGYFKKTTNYKDFFLEGKYLTPCSWVYKLKEYEEIEIPEFATDGTLCKAFIMLVNDKVGFIEDTTCTYRIIHSGASHNSDLKVRYNYLKGVFETEKKFLKEYSDYFSKEDVRFLYNKRYSGYIPYAVAFNDKPLIKEIVDFRVEGIGWRNRMMLMFSSIPLARKYIYYRLNASVQKGL